MRLLSVLVLLVLPVWIPSSAAKQSPSTQSAATSKTEPRTVTIIATDDMKFDVTTITAKPGEPLRIRLTTRGVVPKAAMAHNVVVLKADTDVVKFVNEGAADRENDFIPAAMRSAVIAKTTFAGPGETVEVVFMAPRKPGRYPYICTFVGHYQNGQKGTLVVR